MMIRIHRFPKLIVWVSGGTFVALALLLLVRWSATASLPTSEEAVQEVRVLLKSQVNMRYMSEIEKSGDKIPDRKVASRWDEELTQLDELAIRDPSLAIPLPSYLLGWPGYVIRVTIDGEVRYFSVRPESTAERSVWLWWVAW